jgi:flagellar hook-basal body complex protein FliE
MIDAINPTASAIETPLSSSVDLAATRRLSPAAATEAPAVDFGAMLGQLAASAAGAVKTAETMSLAGVRGQASVQQVVEAVMAAEQTLQGAIAVRDKVVSAYLELSRMSI